MSNNTEVPNCEHHYITHMRSPLYVRLCSFCHTPDWDDLAEQLHRARSNSLWRKLVMTLRKDT